VGGVGPIDARAPPRSKLLGHRSLGTTVDVYTHLTPSMRAGAAARMGSGLNRRAKSV
jgi:integrase